MRSNSRRINTGPLPSPLIQRDTLVESSALVYFETRSHGLRPAGPALDAGRSERKARLAYPCGVGPAAHHPGEDARRRRTGVGPDQYRLRPGLDDHRSVPVGLSVGALPHHQRCTRCSTCGAEFYHISDSSCTRSCPRYALAGSRSHLREDRGYVDFAQPSRGLVAHPSMLIASIRRSTIARRGIICATRPSPWHGFYTRRIPDPELLRRIRFKDPEPARSVFIANNFSLPAATIKSRCRWNSSSSGSSSIFGSSSSTATSENAGQSDFSVSSSPSSRSARPSLALHFVRLSVTRKCPYINGPPFGAP